MKPTDTSMLVAAEVGVSRRRCCGALTKRWLQPVGACATVAPRPMKSQPWSSLAAVVLLLSLGYAATIVAVPQPWEPPWFNDLLRAGFVAGCLAMGLFQSPQHLPVVNALPVSRLRWLQLRWTGMAVASLLICVGALITWTSVGYLVAACTYVFGCLCLYIVEKLGWPWRTLQSSADSQAPS